MAIQWLVFFTDEGVPATGLTGGGSAANVTIYKVSNGSTVVTTALLTEVGGGWYKYLQVDGDVEAGEHYVAVFDGDTLDVDSDRYIGAADLDNTFRVQVKEIHQIHGLDPAAPLVVDASTPSGTRDAGADISQTVETSGNVTTVERQP